MNVIDIYAKTVEEYLFNQSLELTDSDNIELSKEYDKTLLDAYTKIGEYIEEELSND